MFAVNHGRLLKCPLYNNYLTSHYSFDNKFHDDELIEGRNGDHQPFRSFSFSRAIFL